MPGRVVGLLVAAAVLLAAAVGALILNLQRLHDSSAVVEHTNAVLHEIARAERALLRAESGERGWVLSGDESYLESYRQASEEVGHSVAALDHLVADNPAQVALVRELRPVVDARLAEFARIVELVVTHREAALTLLGAARVSQRTRQVAALMEQMRAAEQVLLAERQQTAGRVAFQMTGLAIAMTVLAVLGTAFGAYLLERQHAMAQVHSAELRTAELQAELLHVSRLSNMGEMASALAHELNQPLTALAGYIQGSKRLLDQIDGGEKVEIVKGALAKAVEQALRAGEVIRRLREFVARGESAKRAESLKALVDEASSLALLAAKDRTVYLSVALDPAADEVLVDKIQIQQVLLNLMRNGIEAMHDGPRRELSVASAAAADGMVAVTVSDTGSGIDAAVAATLFQPFRTTKKHGLGVGLSICRTIVEAHGGRIETVPNPGGGTVFRFTLPSASLERVRAAEAAAD